MAGKSFRKLIFPLAVILVILPLSAARTMPDKAKNSEQQDSLVRLVKASSLALLDSAGRTFRKTLDAEFLHSGTRLICDTALWNVDAEIIKAYGHVKLIQGETELRSDKLNYYIEPHLAQFRGSLVELRNKDGATLRTMTLDYNTRDSLATFRDGASMRDADGQIIESDDGNYDSRTKTFTFRRNVNMFTDSVFVKTNHLRYESQYSRVDFVSYIDFWKDDNMLSAPGGWYDRSQEIFFFRGGVHAMSPDQEVWCDTLFYYRTPNDILMLGDAQIQDPSRKTSAVSEYAFYQDSTATLIMERDAAVAMETERYGKTDTLYVGADTLVLNTVPMCDVAESELEAAKTRIGDMMTDPVTEFRRKAAEEAAKAAAEAAKNDPNRPPELPAGKAPAALAEAVAPTVLQAAAADTLPAAPDSLVASADSIAALPDSLPALPDPPPVPSDSLAAAPDSLPAGIDSLSLADSLAVADSLALADSLDIERDSTKISFLTAVGKVRAFRKDMQLRCDSLRYCDLDSIARFYIDPIVWNEGNRQYTADSLFVLVKNSGIDRASLMSNAFIITQEDTLCFNQIKGTDVMAYFDSTSALSRFDALGGATAMFYLKEKDAFATVNKVECKMLSAYLTNGELDRVFYFESPKNDAWPLAQMKSSEKTMKGFNWQPENRPSCPGDITSLRIKSSERSYYENRPKTSFVQTDFFFPGYMEQVYKSIEEARIRKREAERRRNEKESAPAVDSLLVADSLSVADSLMTPVDSLLATADSVRAEVDSLSAAVDSLNSGGAVADSLRAASDSSSAASAALLSPAQQRAAERAAKREASRRESERKRLERIAAREARWARLDSLDSLKTAVKIQKKLERKREDTRRAYLRQLAQERRDNERLQKYIERYTKKKQREENRRKPPKGDAETPGELAPGTEAGGELQTPPES